MNYYFITIYYYINMVNIDLLEQLIKTMNQYGGMDKMKLSLLLPSKIVNPIANRINYKDYSNITLYIGPNVVQIEDYIGVEGGFGKMYNGRCNDNLCLIKISYEKISNISCTEYKNQFITLNQQLYELNMIPTTYLYATLDDVNSIQDESVKYDKSTYIQNVNLDQNECIFILCVKKFDYDLLELYNYSFTENLPRNLFFHNKAIIENKILEIIEKITLTSHIFADFKPENIVVKLNENGDVFDVKLIDIDPTYYIPVERFFKIDEVTTQQFLADMMIIYKHILSNNMNNSIFSDTNDSYDLYKKIRKYIIPSQENKNAIINLDYLVK